MTEETTPSRPSRPRWPHWAALVALLAAVVAVVRHPPSFLLDALKPKLETTLSEAIGAPIRIGSIDSVTLGLLRQEVVVGKLSLAESPQRPDATFVAADEVRIRWSGLSYALGNKEPADITLVHPSIRLHLDKKGDFAFQPTSSGKPAGPYPHGPDLQVRWELADVLWQDDRVHLAKTLQLPQGRADLQDLRHLTWHTGGSLAAASLTTTGSANLETGQGQASLQFDKLDPKPFLVYSPKLPVTLAKASLAGQVSARFADWGKKELAAQGNGTVSAAVRSPHWRGDLTGEGRWRLTESQIALDPLTAKLAGQPVTVKGRVQWKPKLYFDLAATGRQLSLDKLAKAIPSLVGKPLHGEADLTANVRGRTFMMAGVLSGRGLGYGPYKTGHTVAPYRLDDKGISLQPVTTFGGGTITSRVDVAWQGPVRMTVDADVSRVAVAALVPGLKENTKLPSALDGHLHLAGPPDDPKITASLRSGSYGLPHPLPPLRDIQLAADGSLSSGGAQVTAMVGGGSVAVAANWAGDAIRGRMALNRVPATLLAAWVPDVQAGRVDWQGDVRASRKALEQDWRDFSAAGTLSVANLVWAGRPGVGTQSRWHWDGGQFRLAGDWVAGADRLNLAVNGRVPRRASGIPPLHVAWKGDVVNLASWLPDTQVQRGVVHTEGDVRYAGGWSGDARMTVGDLTVQQAGLGGGRLHVRLAGQRLSILDGLWRRGAEQLRLGGTVDLVQPSPVLALQARIEQAAVESLLQEYQALTRRHEDKRALPARLPVTDRLPRLDKRPAVLNSPGLSEATLPDRIPLIGALEYWAPIARMYPPMATVGEATTESGVKVTGRLSAYVRITGTVKQPVVTGSGALTDVQVDENRVASARFRGQWAGARWALDDLTLLSGNGGVMRATGEVRNGRIQLQANGKGIDVGLLKPVMAPYGYVMTGGTDLEMDVSGAIDNPTAILSLRVNHGRLNENPFDSLDVLASLENAAIDISRLALKQGTKGATMTGRIPLSSYQPMEISLRADDDSLGLMSLFTRQAEWLGGRGLFTLLVTGTASEPKLDGKLVLKNGRLYLPSLGETLDSLNGTVLFNNRAVPVSRSAGDNGPARMRTQNQISIAALTGRYNGGQIAVDGTIELPWKTEPGFWGLKVSANDILIRRGGLYDGRATAALTIRNELSDPVISGKVVLPKGTSSLSRGAQSEVAAGGSTTRKEPLPFRISNLRVEVGDEFWVRTPIFELQPHGMVVVDWRNLTESPTVRGTLESSRGTLTLGSYQFKVTEAKAEFVVREFDQAVSPINPKLDMTITGSIPNPRTPDRRSVPVEGHLSAFLENLETQNAFKLTWKNDAGLSDEEITKVVTGGTISEVASGNIGQVASDISPLVTRALFDPITDRLAQLLALDEVNIGLGSSLADPAFRVSLTKPLWGGVSLGFSRIFAASPTTTFSLRYRLANNLSLSYEYEDPKDRSALGTMSAQYNARF